MDRVAFLIERSGARIACMLNPESVVQKRWAGIRPMRSGGGFLTSIGLSDDPLLYTGGGTTELRLDLLFDVSLTESSIKTNDVRDLTRPLWELSENEGGEDGFGRPPIARFVWGTSWNVRGLVAAIAERLEFFSSGGAPSRSWLRMRFLRIGEPTAGEETPAPAPPSAEQIPGPGEIPADQVEVHELLGGSSEGNDAAAGERLDEIAFRYYGNPAFWRVLARFNSLEDPLHLRTGLSLHVPPLSLLTSRR